MCWQVIEYLFWCCWFVLPFELTFKPTRTKAVYNYIVSWLENWYLCKFLFNQIQVSRTKIAYEYFILKILLIKVRFNIQCVCCSLNTYTRTIVVYEHKLCIFYRSECLKAWKDETPLDKLSKGSSTNYCPGSRTQKFYITLHKVYHLHELELVPSSSLSSLVLSSANTQ